MKLYRCGMPNDGADPLMPATPEGFGFMWRLDARQLVLPRFSRLNGPVNGGEFRYGDVGISAEALDTLVARMPPAPTHSPRPGELLPPQAPAAVLFDLADTNAGDAAAHAYVATLIDRIKVRFPKAIVGVMGSVMPDLVDFAAPDLSPIAPVGLNGSPQWLTFDACRKAMAARIIDAAESGKPIIGLLAAEYLYPGPLYQQPIGEPELSIALELLAGARADLAIMTDSIPRDGAGLRHFRGVARRLREIIAPSRRLGAPPVASAPEPV